MSGVCSELCRGLGDQQRKEVEMADAEFSRDSSTKHFTTTYRLYSDPDGGPMDIFLPDQR